ncbi:MAG TPA: tetratricopeptide repeat protein [Terracidiphilus sp.]
MLQCLRVGVAASLACGLLPVAAQETNASKVVPPRQSQTFADETSQSPQSLAASEADLKSKAARPDVAPADLYQLGLVLRLEHKYKDSLEVYTRAAAAQQPEPIQLRSVALDYVQLNDYADAIHWLRIALGMQPENVDILYSLGRCFFAQNDLVHAEAAFTRVLQLQPDHLKAEENLGLTYDGENKPRLAEQALRTAAEWAEKRSLKDEWPYIDLGTLLLDQSRAADATPILQKAVATAPQSAPAHEKLGRALLESGKPADAVPELQKATNLDPQDAKAHFELGRAYRDAGQAERARVEFDLCKKLYGTHNQD